MSETRMADVCLLLEGTYPYVHGGVSSWVHDLLHAHKELSFHLVCLMPDRKLPADRYAVPDNVLSRDPVFLDELPPGPRHIRNFAAVGERLAPAITQLLLRGDLVHLAEIMDALGSVQPVPGGRLLLGSPEAWDLLVEAYRGRHDGSSFIDFFWSWQALLGGLFSVLLAPLPPARVYHVVSTGYAGLMAARARVESGRPVLLTEHGIYTNERRIELAMSDWLHDRPVDTLAVGGSRRELKDLWVDAFVGYSRCCYQACDEIITLYTANQQFQLEDGAPPERLSVIPNGIDYEAYAAVERDLSPRPPTVGLIGRVVPIKDIKTYIRACELLRRQVPELRALVLGPYDEDPGYFQECEEMVQHLGLGDTLEFLGKVKLTEYLGKIDALALTSISEAQPLVILEAGAAGVPTVATDVGSCEELLLGRPDEEPKLGPGGAVVPLSNPQAVAEALARILNSEDQRERYGEAMRERVRLYYNKVDLDAAYARLYATAREKATVESVLKAPCAEVTS